MNAPVTLGDVIALLALVLAAVNVGVAIGRGLR